MSDDRTDEQIMQHTSVISAAAHNLALVIDQIVSLRADEYSDVVEKLQAAQASLDRVRGQ